MKESTRAYAALIEKYTKENFKKCLREPSGYLKYKFIVPGSFYSDDLWDWDSWLTDLALRKVASNEEIADYEKGCVLNFLEQIDEQGRMPIYIRPNLVPRPRPDEEKNIHKPCLAQHALFIVEQTGESEWLREKFSDIERYITWYDTNCYHESGLYFWLNDYAIGVDNDPCTFYRPPHSSASIYLNCMMFCELEAIGKLWRIFGDGEKAVAYEQKALALKAAIQEHCWDERDGFFYNVDINLLPVDLTQRLHSGCPRHWCTLIQRIGVWAGFMALWAGIATPEQAERIVREHYCNEKTFNAPYGVRTLSKMEKMYAIIKSGNPSCWLGPIWGISNYMVFDGLRKYGYVEEATELAEKTIELLGRDLEESGELHEYYHPETGEGIINPGFQNWNLLSLNMAEWLENINKTEE